jgi:S-DNA-T family DNA segregation ATPase FtsK/SpoIIIE
MNLTEEMERLVRDQAVHLEAALQQYNIQGEVVGIDTGPTITLYEVRLAPGTKVSVVFRVSSDLARSLRAPNIRVVPNMVGKDTVGIEVPNLKKERVRLKELMTANADLIKGMMLPMFLGKDASGNPQIADLATMPHMLIAGTTGSGKSVCLNSIIMSFLMTKRPDELKLVLVDPKMVEMSMFKDIPHLMCPVVTEMPKATAILEWATVKMDERYELLAEAGVRDIAGYNTLGWDELKSRFMPASESEEARIPKKLPYMVFVIDELADLMMTNKEVEGFIVRIAQKARAAGIHLILATQRPQANVVTGLIKSNMPCRISFKVASAMDSRIVLDQKGAELLLGQGDMLFLSPRSSKLTRAQGTLVDDGEVRKVVTFLKTVAEQNFEPQLVQLKSLDSLEEEFQRDPMFDDAVRIVLETKRGSVSLLQRRLTIGYGRASRLIEQMAESGILGEYKGSQAREVNLTIDDWEIMRAEMAKEEQEAKAAADALADNPDTNPPSDQEPDPAPRIDGLNNIH